MGFKRLLQLFVTVMLILWTTFLGVVVVATIAYARLARSQPRSLTPHYVEWLERGRSKNRNDTIDRFVEGVAYQNDVLYDITDPSIWPAIDQILESDTIPLDCRGRPEKFSHDHYAMGHLGPDYWLECYRETWTERYLHGDILKVTDLEMVQEGDGTYTVIQFNLEDHHCFVKAGLNDPLSFCQSAK